MAAVLIQTQEFAPIQRLRTAIQTAKAAYARRLSYLQAVKELRGLSDRELADLGILRHDIPELAWKHVYG